jgi:phage baseplate assembly protein W
MYKDVNKNDSSLVYDVDAVKGYINNVLNTKKGELPFKRRLGTDLEKYLFQPYTFVTLKLLESEIKRSLARWVPMAQIKEITTNFNPDSEQYEIMILFKVKGLEDIYSYSTTMKIKGNNG